MKLYTFEEVLDLQFGKKGTPKRDEFENDMRNWCIGDFIKQTRHKQQLTRKQLGKLMGVKKARISKIESGKGLSLFTIVRVFKAMGAKSVTLDLDNLGRIDLR